jgi:phage baseplate assembly protein gpV
MVVCSVAISGLVLLAGCGNQGDKAKVPVEPKWKGAPYRLALETKAAKPNPSGVTLPGVKFTANPEALEKRAILVIRFDDLGATKYEPRTNKMIMSPVDISGAEGALPADYIGAADKELATFLGTYCAKGKIKISVALARSSLSSQALDTEVDAKRLSDWQPIELVFKNPHPKC